MNVYFTASYRGAEAHSDALKVVLDSISASGHKVSKRSFRRSSSSPERDQKVKDIIDLRDTDVQDSFKLITRKIREADVVIADTSVPSSGVGYEIAIAITEKKPILALHHVSTADKAADVLAGNSSKLFRLKTYDTPEEANKIVESFMKEARDYVDTKFILIISPQIDRYLEWSSEEKRMHKAQIVRNAVEDMIEKDKEYKQFLKDLDS